MKQIISNKRRKKRRKKHRNNKNRFAVILVAVSLVLIGVMVVRFTMNDSQQENYTAITIESANESANELADESTNEVTNDFADEISEQADNESFETPLGKEIGIAYFFDEGTDALFYDQGIVKVKGKSEFMKTHVTGNTAFHDKIPVNNKSFVGETALAFSYMSSDKGEWKASVYPRGWKKIDIRKYEYISFYIFSETDIPKEALPLIGVGAGKKKERFSKLYELGLYNEKIPANTWTQVIIPVSVFIEDEENKKLDFEFTSSIIFRQSEEDGSERRFSVDEIVVYTLGKEIESVKNFTAKSYDSHIELQWNEAIEGLNHQVYVSYENDANYQLLAITQGENYMHFIPVEYKHKKIYYKIISDFMGTESSAMTTFGVTREFSDDELMNMVQQYAFRFYWDAANEKTGMALESSFHGEHLIATGASGMSLMSMVVAYDRAFEDREEILDRVLSMLNFLQDAERFHGAWAHWYDDSGRAVPFTIKDDGGDLVETSFVAVGLVTVKNYFGNIDHEKGQEIKALADTLWREIEWTWYQNGTDWLYWHWSPNYDFDMNMALRAAGRNGENYWNETLVTYLMAGSSPTYPISRYNYDHGWAVDGKIVKPRTFYGVDIKLNADFGGNAFWTQYSFLGIDPRNLEDSYANYWEENKNSVAIHIEHAKTNPKGFKNVGEHNWGLTANANPYFGYTAHWPNGPFDNGTISPTGAIGNMPYQPEAAMKALKYFYRERHLFGKYGFFSAFNDNMDRADDFLAIYGKWEDFNPNGFNREQYIDNCFWSNEEVIGIDIGPMIIMIENHRTGLLWDIVMSDEDVKAGLKKLGFK